MNKAIIIVGPTAVGKTEYAIDVAQNYGSEIISADSMQIYDGFNIGSAKPTAQELATVKHHFIGNVDPQDDFSVAEYQPAARQKIQELLGAGKMPVVAGGTGLYVNSLIYKMDFSETEKQSDYRDKMELLAKEKGNEYIHSLLKNLDPEAAERLHPNNLKRVIRALELLEIGSADRIRSFDESLVPTEQFEPRIVFLDRDREELYNRINMRVDILVEKGLVEEIQSLKSKGLGDDFISMKGIGYKEILGYLNGEYDLEHAIYLVKRNSRRYAKRQITWFKKYSDALRLNLSLLDNKDDALKAIYDFVEG